MPIYRLVGRCTGMGIEANLATSLAEAVRSAGGQSSFARLISRNQSTVYDWLRLDKPLPAELCATVEEATGVPRERLRPDIFVVSHNTDMTVRASAVLFDRVNIPHRGDA